MNRNLAKDLIESNFTAAFFIFIQKQPYFHYITVRPLKQVCFTSFKTVFQTPRLESVKTKKGEFLKHLVALDINAASVSARFELLKRHNLL